MTKLSDHKSYLLNYFQTKHFEMPFVFYAGLTRFKDINFAELLPLISEKKDALINLFMKCIYSMLPPMIKSSGAGLLFVIKLTEIRELTPDHN